MTRHSPRRSRRGVLLLVVLALLAMFAMVAVAFVVITGSEKRSADRLRTMEVVNDQGPKTIMQGFDVVVRGTTINAANAAQGTTCAIKWCSLLEKIYGYETIGSPKSPAKMSGTTLINNGQLIEFTLPAAPPDTSTFSSSTIDPFRTTGCVLTMLSGRCAGLSTRIVGVNPSNFNAQMTAFAGGVQPAQGDQYIVNGFPYSGMGFGFSGGVGLSNLALTPNVQPAAWGTTNGIVQGGANNDCTVADFTDPLVALEAPDPTTGSVIVAIPSLQRSDLVVFSGATGGNLRQVMFRPNQTDHPLFTGSNPNFNPQWDGVTPRGGSWDVDNQGRGRPDSVWVDLGLPVRFTADGRAYKPLFAILCLDMDGRLNINAHGSYAQAQMNYYQQMANSPMNVQPTAYQAVSPQDPGMGKTPQALAYVAGPAGSANSTPPVALPRGQGMGVGEVNLWPLFRNAPNSFGAYQAVLAGSGGLMGRYGAGPNAALPLPGVNGSGSLLTLNNSFPYSGVGGGNSNYWTNFQTVFDAYGSPPDTHGIGAYALDRAGRPLYISMGGGIVNSLHDIDLTRDAAHAVEQQNTPDNPFGVAEFEKIMRPYDRDAPSLPLRLASLTSLPGGGSFLQYRGAEFTTESEYVPVAPGVLPAGLRMALGGRSFHPVDLLTAKLPQGAASNQGNLNAMRVQLLPWEILQGLKMDLNRPFGSGAFSQAPSDKGTLTVAGVPTGAPPTIPDQPGTMNEHVPQYINGTSAPATATFNYVADAGAASKVGGAPVNDSLSARQVYARHLYVLALALCDTNAILADLQKTNSTATMDDAVRVIAQWAVNVVAYRDHNGIMIPFPYDPNPFSGNGWNPDNTILHTVWGCKRPELLITETLAFHDRRTQDRNDETVNTNKPGRVPGAQPGYTTDTGLKKDPSFNSHFRPQGSLFVELYNPWTILEPHTTDLGPSPPTGATWPNGGVQLNKVTASVGGKQSPVWRLVIVDPSANPAPANGDDLPDPDSPILANRPIIERVAYFVPLAGLAYPTDGQVSYCPTVGAPGPVVVPPSGYAVIGSGDPNYQHRTFIGFEMGLTMGQPAKTRMVTLNPSDIPAGDGRVVRNTSDPAVTANPPQLLPIDGAIPANGTTQPQRLSVSEPTRGYPPYEKDPTGAPIAYNSTGANIGTYSKTLDIPVDQQRYLISKEGFRGQSIWQWLNNDGTIPAFRIIYLQRLADPTRPYIPDIANAAGYNPDPRSWNPFRTVDAMTVDLTTFNGVTSAVDPTRTNQGLIAGVSTTYHFEARQRGERNYLPGNAPTLPAVVGEANVWKQEPASKAPANVGWVNGGVPPTGNQIFNKPLNQTLGYLNQPFGKPSATPTGDPRYPFPWLYWSYRPFNNEYELLVVPAVSSSRLLARASLAGAANQRRYYGYVDGTVRGSTYPMQDVYDGSSSGLYASGSVPYPQVPYPHLLNYFESSPPTQTGIAAQFSRVLAYVGVPSRFANTQIQMRADLAGSPAGTAHSFHTPFNRISRYREPGRINLNTVTSPDVLMGLMNTYYPSVCPAGSSQLNPVLWDKFVRSRRGDGSISASPTVTTQQSLMNMFTINKSSPSRFMRPYRTPGGAPLTLTNSQPQRETDVSMLRADPDVPLRPLWQVDDYFMNTGSAPASETPDQFPNACIDYNRNPTFRYQLLQKMGNAVSNHSNVFAIWITVGYFEALPASNPNAKDANGVLIYPDGYQLGQEMGSDSGDIVRHRAFFIFDRSIPVGFVRGQDINHENAILLKRFIE